MPSYNEVIARVNSGNPLKGGGQPDSVEWYLRQGSDADGVGVRLLNSDGDTEFSLSLVGEDVYLDASEGFEELDIDIPKQLWTYMRCDFYWPDDSVDTDTATVDLWIEDIQNWSDTFDGSCDSGVYGFGGYGEGCYGPGFRALKNSVDLETIQLINIDPTGQTDTDFHGYIDNVAVLSERKAQLFN